jgi:uncharacterized membrane protein YphA (DoxX/SURF4 family)
MNSKWIGFLRIVLGLYILAHGINKVDWFRSSEFMRTELQSYAADPHQAVQWVQHRIVLPYAEIWARAIPAGEMLIGAALIAGFLARTALGISVFMVLLYHVADGKLFTPQFVTDPTAMLLAAVLTALAFLRPASVFAVKKTRR